MGNHFLLNLLCVFDENFFILVSTSVNVKFLFIPQHFFLIFCFILKTKRKVFLMMAAATDG